MGILDKLADRERRPPLTEATTLRTIIVAGEKGGVGKTLTTELLSILLDDAGVAHLVEECESAPRLGRRLGKHVVHHPLHEEDARLLAEDPDALHTYWDRVYRQMVGTVTVVDLAANALRLMLRWASSRATNAALRGGLGIEVVLVATADSASLSGTLTSARQVRTTLPNARIWVVLNGIAGAIRLDHPGVAQLLHEIRCERPIMLPVCRAPDAGILKNLSRFDSVALLPEAELVKHGIELLRAGRALEGFQDWLLASCQALRPVLNGVLAPRE